MSDQAQQVAEAASLVVRPETDHSTRQAASTFLESWTQSERAWELFGPWLASFTADHSTQVGVHLLCLQLLRAKMRRELPGTTPPASAVEQIRAALSQLILQSQQGGEPSVLQSACICLTSLEIRTGNLVNFVPQIISNCRAEGAALLPCTALRLLSEVPTEAESCAELKTHQVTATLTPYWDTVIEVVAVSLQRPETSVEAAQCLRGWTQGCHVSLSQLNSPLPSSGQTVLPMLVHVLSQSPSTNLVTAVSEALTTVLRQPIDSCTETRKSAVIGLVEAVRADGFVGRPLQAATVAGDESACHALVTLLATLVTEDVDEIVQRPADGLLSLLLEIQARFPLQKIRSLALEIWLNVQEVPTAERHLDWKAPLMARLTESLLEALAFPPEFTNWEEEVTMDESDFNEFRQMVPDVLTSCYLMLRVDFVRRMAQGVVPLHHQASWTVSEAALVALSMVSRDVCDRIDSTMASSKIRQDREATVALIGDVCQSLLSAQPRQTEVLMESFCDFFGGYSSAWKKVASTDSILRMVDYLRIVWEQHHQSGEESKVAARAAGAVHAILVVCEKLVEDSSAQGALLHLLQTVFASALATNREGVMLPVTEGCVRLLVQISDPVHRDQSLAAMVKNLTLRGHEALTVVPLDGSPLSEAGAAGVDALARYLKVMRLIIKFSQNYSTCGPHLLSSAMSQSGWPFLEAVSQRITHYEVLLEFTLDVQEQLLKSAPELLSSQFSSVIQNCVAIFESTKNPATLSYISSAVEVYGAREATSFESLLSHVSNVFFAYISTERPARECSDLVEAYFELSQRYLLFCPAGIVRCESFPAMVACGIECLTALDGERNATRAILNFLNKVYGWRRLPITADARQALEIGSQRLDELIVMHGQRYIQCCVDILVGGPRMLWPACSDCIFTAVSAAVSWPVPENSESSVAQQWLEGTSLKLSLSNDIKGGDSTQIFHQIAGLLLQMAQKGAKSKPAAKMLLSDFSLIVSGQISLDTLNGYKLQ